MTRNLAFFAIFSTLIFSGCGRNGPNPYTPEVKSFYESSHELRKMFNREDKVTVKTPGEGHLEGGFFLLIGGVSGSYKEGSTAEYVATNVRFAWEVKDNTYAVITVPIEKVRVKIAEKVEVPTVAFFLDEFKIEVKRQGLICVGDYNCSEAWIERSELRLLNNNYDAPEFLNGNMGYLKYLVITCNSSDWPQNISLPLQ